MMGWYHAGLGWGGWLLMAVAMVAFWGLVVAAVLAVFRTGAGVETPSAQDLLDQRLARGELSAEEYRTLREALHEPFTGPPATRA